MSTNKKRIQWIDVARGICMLSVIAGHMGWTEVGRFVYSYHLTVFFILGGYMLKDDLSAETLNKRFKSLMVPYFVTCFAVIVMDVLNAILVTKQTDIETLTGIVAYDLLRSFMGSGSAIKFGTIELSGRIGAIWFLPAMFFAALITQLLLKCASDRKTRYGIAVSLAILSCFLASFIWLPFSILSGVFAVPLLLLGYDAKQHDLLNKISLKRFLICLAVFAAGWLMNKTQIYYVELVMWDIVISVVCALASSGCIFYLSQKLEHNKPLAWIGRNSIFFLCVHLFEVETMPAWYMKLLEILGINYSIGWHFVLSLLFTTVGMMLVLKWKSIWARIKYIPQVKTFSRDTALDIAKAILILLMIVGHYTANFEFLKIIYSFHMMAFVFYSGYCFKPEACRNLKRAIWGLVKNFLVPYGIFGVWYILANHDGIDVELRNLIFGFSWTRKFFTGFGSVGPVYFILLLLLVRLLYLLIQRYVTGELTKNMIVIGLVFFGMHLGEQGWWLPWSLDIALYALIFYHLGYYFKKYNIMEYLTRRGYLYFVLSSIWAYAIYIGSMEITDRNYGTFGITALGAISASVLLYMMCRYLYDSWGNILNIVASRVGMSTMYILIVHVALGDVIKACLSPILAEGHIYYCAADVIIQVLLGVLLAILCEFVKGKIFAAPLKRPQSSV